MNIWGSFFFYESFSFLTNSTNSNIAGRTWVFFLDLYDMTVYMFKHRDKEEVFMFFLVHMM